MLVTLLSIYSLALTGYVIRAHRIQYRQTELDNIWKSITDKPDPSAEELKTIARVAKVRQTEIPWYERSVSTIGLVAFLSMIIATSFQTINSAKTDIESSNVRQEIKVLESQRAGWKKMLKSLSEVIVLKQMDSGKIEDSEKDVLKQRLKDLEDADSGLSVDELERLQLYLALQEYDNAASLVEKSSTLANGTSPEHLLLLAETSFLDGAKGRTKFLLNKFEPTLSKQPVEWQVRFFVVKAALDVSPTSYSKDVAAVKGMGLTEAEELLSTRVEQLKQQARRRAVGAVNKDEDAPTK
jgi:hypothetical protein